jgi:hypothetical protein
MAAVIQRVVRQSVPAGPWNLPGFGICVAILVLNLLDALFTMAFLKFNLAEEANPLMNIAYRTSPLGFVLLKLAMVQVGILILHHHRRVRVAEYALNAVAAVYVGIVSYHLAFVAHIAWR